MFASMLLSAVMIWTGSPNGIEIRRMHLVRPDLVPYPIPLVRVC